jgi:porin
LEQFQPAVFSRAHASPLAARSAAFILLFAIWLLAIRPALAQAPAASPDSGAAQPAGTAGGGQPAPEQTGTDAQPGAAPTGFWDRSNLLGDAGGLRTTLDGYGISLGLSETSEVLGNPTGGRAQGTIYEGLTEMTVGIDLGKAIGLPGGIFNVSALQIHGRGLSTNNIDNLMTVSNIEADPSTDLYELWYQQSFFGGKMDVKIGQQSADLEFMVTQYGGLFINSSFGWPELPSADLPSGGATYPLATPGVRLRVQPTDSLTVLLGVFNGSPAGLGSGDPQLRNPSGTDFNMNSGVFVIGEVHYAINQEDGAKGLPGTYKLGAWYNSNAFPNEYDAVANGTVQRLGRSVDQAASANDWDGWEIASNRWPNPEPSAPL